MTLSGDNDAAVAFLEFMHPDRQWTLTAIAPDRKNVVTRSFSPDERDVARQFIEANNGRANLYFSTNTANRPLNKKAKREDILQVEFLHVDIDPRDGYPLEAEQERIRRFLIDEPPNDLPPATAVVFTGGGYQAFWRLQQPIAINGVLSAAEDAKLYNLAIEQRFSADSCHNIDRVMRVAGTINVPDAKKTQRGRRPAQAKVITLNPDRVYPLHAFTPAARPRSDQSRALGRPGEGKASAVGAAETEKLESIDHLDRWKVPDRVKIVIVQGRDPDNPKVHDNSRSTWLFDVVCNLLRCGVPEALILGIIMDTSFGISDSVLDKGLNAERYAARQIERAKEFLQCPELLELNERHFVIENDGGKCRIAEWRPSFDDGREQLSMQSFEDFRNRYNNRLVTVASKTGVQQVPLGKFWIGHPQRRQFKGLIFRPGQELESDGYLNLWRGFGIEPKAGDWSIMAQHVREVLADGDESAADYITKWAAWAVQNAHRPAEVALVFQGGQGTGKGTFARALARLFGQHGLQVTAPAQFAGRFNSHLRDVCLLFADEAVLPDDKAARSVLKALLTEPRLPSEAKGRDIVEVPNFVKVVMASNEKWIVPVEIGDRRFAVFRLSESRKNDHDYFRALNAEIENGGLTAMLHDLLALDLGNWHPRKAIPQTTARDEQKAYSMTGIEAVLLDILRAGEMPDGELKEGWVFCATSKLQAYATDKRRGPPVTLNEVASLLSDLGFMKDDKKRPRGFLVPPLPQAREAWAQRKFGVSWDATQDWSVFAFKPDHPF